MSPHSWPDVAIAVLVSLPSIIAAVSSLKNHHKISRQAKSLDENTRITQDVKRILNGAQPQ